LGWVFAFLVILVAGCARDSTCKCSYNCEGDTLYCISDGDGGVLCYTSPDLVPSGPDVPGTGDEDVSTEPGEDSATGGDSAVNPGEDVEAPQDLPEPLEDVDSPPDDTVQPKDTTSQDTSVPEPDEVTPPEGPFEFRGVWVTRWDYKSEADVVAIMDKVQAWGFNAVMFQVRGNADAFYQSSLEPWGKELTGTLGKDPGWDPLAVATAEAHERGMELHAWLNTFTAWTGTTPPPQTSPEHILYAHPDWRQADSSGKPMAFNNSYTWVSPGIPAVRQHIKSVVLDIADGYDVDGIHFDYIRYAGPDYSHDTWSEDAYLLAKQANAGLSYGDFQRETLAAFVGEAYDAVGSKHPGVKVTASVWGIYQDNFGWGGTSEGYYDYFQDSHGWMGDGSLDAICPMIYWPLTDPKGGWTDYATLADDHLAAAAGRHVYMGMNADYDSFDEIEAEIEYGRSIGAPGYVVFSYSTLNKKGYGPMLAGGVHSEPASPPPMGWKK
jgi:uncharacterized lipoprotein YddW (UPF0748 family)